MAWYDKPLSVLGQVIANSLLVGEREKKMRREREYFTGEHPAQLNTKIGQYNDNLALNYVGLAIARGVSRLFNGGIEFKLPEGSTAQQEYLDAVWDTNKEEQLLYQVGLNGAVYGTPFIKIVPGGIMNRVTGEVVPRLIALDPEITTVKVNPFDLDEPEAYIIQFTVYDVSHKEVTRQAKPDDFNDPNNTAKSWIIENFIIDKKSGGKWIPDPDKPPVNWPYEFPPIIHWKNLPSLKASHGWQGTTDAEWAVGVQDKLNFADSNINKLIRLNATPPTIATGFNAVPDVPTGPGSIFWTPNIDAKVYNLQANADIAGSMSFAESLQSGVFELMREVPPAVIAQLGSGLTNFVMRVVYSDAIEKTDTKREMYGDALLEINRRLLVLKGFEGEAADPGLIEWGDELPTNPTEQIAEDTFLLQQGLASKETVASHYDIDYEAEKIAIAEEKRASDALGGNMLRDFLAGRGNNQSGNNQPPVIVPGKQNNLMQTQDVNVPIK